MEKKKILILHTKYRTTGGEDIAVDNEAKSLEKVFDIETLYLSNQEIDSYIKQIKYFLFNNNPEINEKLINKIIPIENEHPYPLDPKAKPQVHKKAGSKHKKNRKSEGSKKKKKRWY